MSGIEIEKGERTPWKSEEAAKPEAPKCTTVREIVKKYLKDNGFDGLCFDGECGCDLADLMPDLLCDVGTSACSPGYKTSCDCPDDDHAFHIGHEKEEAKWQE